MFVNFDDRICREAMSATALAAQYCVNTRTQEDARPLAEIRNNRNVLWNLFASPSGCRYMRAGEAPDDRSVPRTHHFTHGQMLSGVMSLSGSNQINEASRQQKERNG